MAVIVSFFPFPGKLSNPRRDQGLIGCLVTLFNLRVFASAEGNTADKISGLGLFAAGSLLSLGAASIASYHQHKHGEKYAYVYCVHDIPVGQRGALLLLTAMFIYLIIMSAVYCWIEGWSYASSVYWSISSLATIGFGDMAPKTNFGRMISPLWTIVGVALIGSAIMALRKAIVDDIARRVEISYFKAFGLPTSTLDPDFKISAGITRNWGIMSILKSIWAGHPEEIDSSVKDQSESDSEPLLSTTPLTLQKTIPDLNLQPLSGDGAKLRSDHDSVACASRSADIPIQINRIDGSARRNTTLGELISPIFEMQYRNGEKRIDASFRKLFLVSLCYFVFHIVSFGILFSVLEGWSYADGVYFSYNTISTIGYGDYVLTTPLSRTMFIWFVLLGSISLTHLFSVVFKAVGRAWSDTESMIENRVSRYHTKAVLKKKYFRQVESNLRRASLAKGGSLA